MATSSQRRFSKLANYLIKLRQDNSLAFIRVWNGYINSWVNEIHARANAQQQESIDVVIPAIFGVFEKANKLADAIDSQSSKLIRDSLIMLKHEAACAVARCTDQRIYNHRVDCTTRVEMRLARPDKKING